jgi:hypothetical protein
LSGGRRRAAGSVAGVVDRVPVPEGRVACSTSATLAPDRPRQNLGAYQEDGENVGLPSHLSCCTRHAYANRRAFEPALRDAAQTRQSAAGANLGCSLRKYRLRSPAGLAHQLSEVGTSPLWTTASATARSRPGRSAGAQGLIPAARCTSGAAWLVGHRSGMADWHPPRLATGPMVATTARRAAVVQPDSSGSDTHI